MKHCKRAISLILTLLMVLPCICMAAFAQELPPHATPVKRPTIILQGLATHIAARAYTGIEGEMYYPVEIPDGYIKEECVPLIPSLMTGLTMDKWKAYNEGLYDVVMPIASPMACNKDGEVTNGSGSPWLNPGVNNLNPNTQFNISTLTTNYDWRLDPFVLADQINAYINSVLAKTGFQKIDVVARCFGGNVLLAYVKRYGAAKLGNVIFVGSSFEGYEAIEAVFAGELNFSDKAIERFSNLYLTTDEYANDPTFMMLREIVTVLEHTTGLHMTAELLNKLFKGIRNDGLVKILRETVATMPGFWSVIGPKSFEKAKAYIFGGYEEEYAGLISKIDNFHYNVLCKSDELLDKLDAAGCRVYDICKYGTQMLPYTGNDYVMADSLVSTARSSFGATCSTIDGKLSSAYLSTADPKYISPDKQIDASTCRYPDHTWFFKNLSHRNMPEWLFAVYAEILNFDGYTTVDDIESLPQFLVATDDSTSFSPETAENDGNTQKKLDPSPLLSFLNLILRFFKLLFSKTPIFDGAF